MADSALVLGGPAGLAFWRGDGPDQLDIKATVDGQSVTLSDGARYFQDTGLTPDALTWTGTFEINGNYGTPEVKAAFVEGLRDTRQRTTLSFKSRRWSGFVQDATMSPVSADRIKYSITFEVEVVGVLGGALSATLGTTGGPQSHAERASAALDRINVLVAQGLSGTTQAANALVQINRVAAGY